MIVIIIYSYGHPGMVTNSSDPIFSFGSKVASLVRLACLDINLYGFKICWYQEPRGEVVTWGSIYLMLEGGYGQPQSNLWIGFQANLLIYNISNGYV